MNLLEQQSETKNWPRNLPFAKDVYPTRIVDSKFTLSKEKQTPYIEFDVEIYAAPDGTDKVTCPIDGNSYVVAGVKDKLRYFLTAKAAYRLGEFMKMIGMADQAADFNMENPPHELFRGKCFSADWGYEEQAKRKDLTPAEKAAGKKHEDAEVLKREDGTPILFYAPRIGQPQGKTKVPAPAF